MQAIKSFFLQELSERRHRQILLLLGHLTFIIMGIFSLVYFKERMLHFDSANYSFHMMYFNDFYTGHNRYISYVVQLLPLQVFRSGADLATVLKTYSFSFILLYYLLFLCASYLFRNPQGGLLIGLALILTLRYKFYAPVGEVIIGIAFSMLIISWLTSNYYQKEGQRPFKIGLAILLSLIMLVVHPFPMISLGLAWGIYMLYYKKWQKREEYILPLSWLISWGLKFATKGSGSSYEQGRLDQLKEAGQLFGNLTESFIWDRYTWYLEGQYALPLALFALTLIYLAYRKRYLVVAAAILSFLFVSVVVIALHGYLDTPIYTMLDGYMSHLGVILAIVFILALGQKRQLWVGLVFSVLVIYSLDRIHSMRTFYQGRAQLLLSVIDEYSEEGEHKLLAHMDAFVWPKLWYPWAVGVETLMMTKLRNPEETKTLYFLDYGQEWLEPKHVEPDAYFSLHFAPEVFKNKSLPVQISIPEVPYKKVDLKNKY